MKTPSPLAATCCLVAACSTLQTTHEIPPAMIVATTVYEAAGTIELEQPSEIVDPALHHVFRLSDNIVSGAEPETEAALRAISELGVKTLLSVDGKAPDAATAAKYGMRYVHVPIRYKGISDDEKLAIAKTFRELDGPFYVHCFHGKHRGPSAAAIGRVILDGAPRDRAVAEMRQWCGTSKKYEGLYSAIALEQIPSHEETGSFRFDFPAEHRFIGTRGAMVEISRAWEIVEQLSERNWMAPDDHPDANALNESVKLAEVFAQMREFESTASRPDDYRGWLADSERDSRELADLLRRLAGGDRTANELAVAEVGQLKASCSACHAEYRNH